MGPDNSPPSLAKLFWHSCGIPEGVLTALLVVVLALLCYAIDYSRQNREKALWFCRLAGNVETICLVFGILRAVLSCHDMLTKFTEYCGITLETQRLFSIETVLGMIPSLLLGILAYLLVLAGRSLVEFRSRKLRTEGGERASGE
jgi:hypothetical protein